MGGGDIPSLEDSTLLGSSRVPTNWMFEGLSSAGPHPHTDWDGAWCIQVKGKNDLCRSSSCVGGWRQSLGTEVVLVDLPGDTDSAQNYPQTVSIQNDFRSETICQYVITK